MNKIFGILILLIIAVSSSSIIFAEDSGISIIANEIDNTIDLDMDNENIIIPRDTIRNSNNLDGYDLNKNRYILEDDNHDAVIANVDFSSVNDDNVNLTNNIAVEEEVNNNINNNNIDNNLDNINNNINNNNIDNNLDNINNNINNNNIDNNLDNINNNINNNLIDIVRLSSDIDFSLLDHFITMAESLNSASYTADSWSNLVTALNNAYNFDRDAATQNDVTVYAIELSRAISSLEYGIDFSTLDYLIAYAESLNPADHTPESWNVLENTLTRIYSIDRVTATQNDVTVYAIELSRAISSLRLVLDFSELDYLITQIETLNSDDYTTESWNLVDNTLNYVNSIRGSFYFQDDVDEWVIILRDAYNSLEPFVNNDINGDNNNFNGNNIVDDENNGNNNIYIDVADDSNQQKEFYREIDNHNQNNDFNDNTNVKNNFDGDLDNQKEESNGSFLENAGASMKSTGVPILAVFLVLLSSLGIIAFRRKKQ